MNKIIEVCDEVNIYDNTDRFKEIIYFKDGKLIKRMVRDLKFLLNDEDNSDNVDVINLWDDKLGLQKFGVQYHEMDDD